MKFKRTTPVVLALAMLAASSPAALADDVMSVPGGNRFDFGASYLHGSLTSETGNVPGSSAGPGATGKPYCSNPTACGFASGNIANRLWGIGLQYTYVLSGIPLGLGIGLQAMVAGSVNQGNRDVRLDTDLTAFLIPLRVSWQFNAGSGLEPYVFIEDDLSIFNGTPKSSGPIAPLPSNGGFNGFSPGAGVGLRYYFNPNWGINASVEYLNLNLNASFTGNAATAAGSRGVIANGTQYNATWNGSHLLAHLGVSAKF